MEALTGQDLNAAQMQYVAQETQAVMENAGRMSVRFDY